jgi:NADH-quinone oxidoreductase subunit C
MGEWSDLLARTYGEGIDGAAELDLTTTPPTVDVPATRWRDALALARDVAGCSFFDWLSAVDEGPDGFRMVAHVARHGRGHVDHVLVRALLPRGQPVVASVCGLYRGAVWHERETHEMFGIDFADEAGAVLAMDALLLPEEFEGHPLRKEFVLAARVAKPWPGAKDPGEPDGGARRRLRPPGDPGPGAWEETDG